MNFTMYMNLIKDLLIKLFFILFSSKKIIKLSETLSIIFTHNLGGGTDRYLKEQLKKTIDPCLIITNCSIPLLFDFYLITYNNKKYLYTLPRLKKILFTFQISEITINSLVSYRKRVEILQLINNLKLKNKCKLNVLFHDFYPICPNYTLFYSNHNCCTHYCLKKEIINYKESWMQTLNVADELRTFSNSSRDILLKFIPEYAEKITVIPHSLDYLKNLTPITYPCIYPMKVGIIGSIYSEIKGLEIIRKLSNVMDLYVFGDISIKKAGIHNMGRYNINTLKGLLEKNKITVVLFSSVCAETFSYVVSEVIALDLPLVGFPIGAQGEKIANYKKGVLCQNYDIESIVCAIKQAYSIYSNVLNNIDYNQDLNVT